MSTDIKDVLTDLGLSETEARMYIAMLNLGPSSVQNIAKRAEVSRTAAYDLIEELRTKGLASSFQKGKKMFFSAEDPGQLESYFKTRIETMKGTLGTLNRLVPELRVMHGNERPRVRFYSGEEGVHALFRDVESLKLDELLELADDEAVYGTIDEEMLLELRELENFKKLKIRSLGRFEPRNLKDKTEARVLKTKDREFHGNVWIYKNRVAFVSLFGEVEVVIIENDIFAQTMRVLFEQAWEASA